MKKTKKVAKTTKKKVNRYNMRNILCNFVEANGPQTWTRLHEVVLTVAGRSLSEKDWGVSYLDNVSSNSVLFPSRCNNRYLEKDVKTGLYYVTSL
jgi:hypothetical protein